jgi:dipeptidyl-peptidase-4
MKIKKIFIGIAVCLFVIASLSAAELKKITFEQAYLSKGEKLYSELPEISGWFDDDHYFYVNLKKLYKVNYYTGRQYLILDPAQYAEVEKAGFDLLKPIDRTKDFNRFLFLKDDDIYLFDRKANVLTRITQTETKEQNPVFSPDGNFITFTREGNLFLFEIGKSNLRQITSDGDGTILNGYASWIYYEEILGRTSKYKAYWWSPDSKNIAFMRFDQSKVPVYTITIFKGDYCQLEKQFYPKPGYPNPDVKIGIAAVGTGTIHWVDFKDDNDHYLAFPEWNISGEALFFQWMNRDQTHMKILKCDENGTNVSVLYEETQKEWLDFLESYAINYTENDGIFLISSRDDWYNLYNVRSDGRFIKLTSGEWIVRRISGYDSKKKIVYFLASKEDSVDTDLYAVSLNDKKIQNITKNKGSHDVMIAPDAKKFIDTHSTLAAPNTMELRKINGSLMKTLGGADSPIEKEYALGKYEMFRIPVSDAYRLPAIWLLPPDFSTSKKYPVIMNVYGGPAAPSVKNAFRQNLGPQFIAQQGIIQLWVDHRGSGHFGKMGEVLMFRRLGYWEMKDFTDVVKYLRTLDFIDGNKIGITGGSYGGYVSALAVCYAPEYFQFADADASVTDWHFYDSVYTERYMDTPAENPDGYKNSSLLTYADNYKGGLRISHGSADDNVHVQNTIVFINQLIEKGKTFEFMLYPEERHGYRGNKRAHNNKDSLNFWLQSFFGREYKENNN